MLHNSGFATTKVWCSSEHPSAGTSTNPVCPATVRPTRQEEWKQLLPDDPSARHLHRSTHLHYRLLIGHFRSGNKCPPMFHMDSLYHRKPYVAVNTAAGIPTGIGLGTIVNFHGQYIAIPPLQIRGQIVPKRTVAIRTQRPKSFPL